MIERIKFELTRAIRHKPIYPGEAKPLDPNPYLRLPLTSEDLSHFPLRFRQTGIGTKIDYSISEGWYYSQSYFGFGHGAVDFALPYGFPVAAPCDGFAMSSYHSFPLTDKKGNIIIRDKIRIRFGIGYFVQIYNPQVDRFIQLGHLSDIDSKIPFSLPERVGDRWEATGHILTRDQMLKGNNSKLVYVEAGETVGFVGYSGLADEDDYIEGYDRPYVIDQKRSRSWSIPHIHMDEFQRNFETGEKAWRRDPYDLYSKNNRYPTHSNNLRIGREPLFLTDQNDRPYHADR